MIQKRIPFGVLTVVVATSVSAQTNMSDHNVGAALLDCAAIQSSAERIQCYDNLAERTKIMMKTQTMRAAKTPTSSANVLISSQASDDTVVTQPSNPAAVVAEASPAVTSEPMPDKFAPAELISRTIERASQDANKDWLFYMNNGEVWKQKDTRRRRMPDFPTTGTLKKGSFGSHRLKIEGESWSMKVKRVK